MASVTFSNPPEFLGLQEYRSAVSKDGGPAKANRFVARIVSLPPQLPRRSVYQSKLNEMSYLCESAEFPGRGFMNIDVRYYGTNFKSPYQTTYEDLNLTFVVRDKFLERQLFDDWMELINPSSTYNFSYSKDYMTTVELFQMSEIEVFTPVDPNKPVPTGSPNASKKLTAQYKFTFEKAWPILINPMPVNWADDNFHRLTVAFTYNTWHREILDPLAPPQFNLVNGSTTVSAADGTWLPTYGIDGTVYDNPTGERLTGRAGR